MKFLQCSFYLKLRYSLLRWKNSSALTGQSKSCCATRLTFLCWKADDDLLVTLMGDKLEPRREFIKNHALEVSELDV